MPNEFKLPLKYITMSNDFQDSPDMPAPELKKEEAKNSLQECVDSIGYLRNFLDTCINSTKFLLPSREVSLCHTNLQRAFAFLGLQLKKCGLTSPYVNSLNALDKTIEPKADNSNTDFSKDWEAFKTQVARVKSFRLQLSIGLTVYVPLKNKLIENGIPVRDTVNSEVAMEDALMWLGWELGRIKIAQEKTEYTYPKLDITLF